MAKTPRAFRLDPNVKMAPPIQGNVRETLLDNGVIMIEEPEKEADDQFISSRIRTRSLPWVKSLLFALGGLILIWIIFLIEGMVSHLLSTIPSLGWIALLLSCIALFSFIALISREIMGLLREKKIDLLQEEAIKARQNNDEMLAIKVVYHLCALYDRNPLSSQGQIKLAALNKDAIIDATDRLDIAERELLAPLDLVANRIVAGHAKQVSLVTAISPRAIVDLIFVLYACINMIRKVSMLYGGRPGIIGFIRLSGNILSHLALTGGLAIGDGIVQQVMGLGLAARLSTKLGEGALNGLLTTRVGLAAIEICRPLPFSAVEPPRLLDLASTLFERSLKTDDTTSQSQTGV